MEKPTVELDSDHPGFRDSEYRSRRNQIAQLAALYWYTIEFGVLDQ